MLSRIFYGWWNVATGFVGMGFSYAMFTIFTFGVFVKPLGDEFGWTRGELSFAITMTNFAVVLASPSLGFIIDRFGVRRVLIPSVTMMGVVVASMSLLSASIWHFYALYFLVPFMLVGIGITSVVAHLVPLLTDRGVAPADAALYMSSLALGLIAGRLLAGFLMDYFFAPYVAACFLLGPYPDNSDPEHL